jgi:hydroxyacylglutathione hydrolase
MEIYTLPVGIMKANCYLLVDKTTRDCLIIDPGDDGQYCIETITKLGVTPQAIIATHGHFDHIMAACEVQISFSIPFFIHPSDRFLVERMQETANHFLGSPVLDLPPQINGELVIGDTLEFGKTNGKILALPGHTPGSVGFWFPEEKILFTGDTIFANGQVGRTDFSYGRPLDLARSVETILNLTEETILYPGHGESSSVADEKKIHTSNSI